MGRPCRKSRASTRGADRLINVLEVKSVRNAIRHTGSVGTFEVEPGLGMRVIPVPKAKP